MSEAEKKRRLAYKKNRKKWMMIQGLVMILVAIMILSSVFVYYRLNKTYYINYTESSDVEYIVNLNEDEFFDDWEGEDKVYISSIINNIYANFKYKLDMETENIDYKYTYGVNAQIRITDDDTGLSIYEPSYVLVKDNVVSQSSNNEVDIRLPVLIDYVRYNKIATDFVETYNLKDVTSTLVVTMNVKVIGNSDSFETDSENTYDVALNIPLTTPKVSVEMSSSVQSGENKVLACKNALNQEIFKTTAIIFGVIEIMLLAAFVAFVYLTRNHDINYAIKVRKLVSNYKSYIQKINNEFDMSGYQILYVNTFNEMLGIRDTIQSPILMSENTDQTCTQFLISTNTKILYLFEIKVEDYDEIYGKPHPEIKEIPVVSDSTLENIEAEETIQETIEETAEETTEEVTTEEVIQETVDTASMEETTEETTEKVTTEEVIQETVDTAPMEETTDEITEEATTEDGIESNGVIGKIIPTYIDGYGNQINIKYSRSFEANIIQSEDEIKKDYSELKNHILSYKGVKSRLSWKFDSFNRGRDQLFKLKTRGRVICLYCALSPEDFDNSKYRYELMNTKLFEDVPVLVKIKSALALKKAKELVNITMAKFGIEKDPNAKIIDYTAKYPYEETEALVERKLIKILAADENIVVKAVEKDISITEKKLGDHDIEIELLNETSEFEIIKETVVISDDEDIVAVEEALASPTVELSEIDFVDEVDEVYEGTDENPGVEVIGVVWPERKNKNKIYRYDPNGEILENGDIVLVPTKDVAQNKEVVRKATVAHANHKIDPNNLKHPLKKIIGVVKRKLQGYLDKK
ncbi:MAG: hypothetical protein J6B60_04150 [Clostridia bacterium]|nr:hypothetical protein [Clostridia bacterium]